MEHYRVHWKRITKLSVLISVLAAIAIGYLPMTHWIKAEIQRRAELPAPLVATPEETRAILGAVLDRMKFVGVPPPPPQDGDPPRPQPQRVLILADQSLCFSNKDPVPNCASEPMEWLLIPELDSVAPRKLRQELVLANQAPSQLHLSGIHDTRVARSSDIQKIFADGWWNDFYKKYPGTSGFARISKPVLTKDRNHALIYISQHCDGLCGTGTIHFLIRSGSSWRIVKEEMVWIS